MDVTFVLTHDCNLGCGYCYAGAKFNKRMPAHVAERALDLAFEDDPPRVELSFFGGEPLLAYDLLVDVAERARARGAQRGTEVRLSVTTNGTLLDDARARTLDALGVHVALSIDGTREAHDSGRPRMGGGSSFDDVVRGLDVLLRRGTTFETISVVTPANVRLLGESVAFLLDRGVPRIGLNPCYEAAFTDDDLGAWHRGLDAAAAKMIDCFRGGRIVSITVFDNKILAALKGGLVETDRCSLGSRSVAVAPSGNIYPCERLVAEDEDSTHAMGNVETGLVVRGHGCARGPVNTECEPCGERDRCSSSCACANLAETGRTDVAGGTQCWHERTTASVADHIAETLWKEQNPYFLAWFYGRMIGGGPKPSTATSSSIDTEKPRSPAGVITRESPKSKHHLRILP
ncbi:MAG: radical SAM protein [Deltaproteobacteria bacterium]|nr:radical SAM protein [Deltaproteobacteria bacterium]